MPKLVPLLTENDIRKRVADIARKISSDYADKQLVMIGVLKGAFIFMADLVRCLDIPVEIDFVRASSYGDSDTSCGEVKLQGDITADIRDKDVLLIEDILDTGQTVQNLIPALECLGPRSVKVCAFIDKYERRQTDCHADYTCHSVEGGFLVGYGLDYAEQYRNLPAIYDLKLNSARE